MRILHLVHQYLPEKVGGTELYTKWVAEELSRRDHEVHIFYRADLEGAGLNKREEDNVIVWRAWAGRLNPTKRFLASFRNQALVHSFEAVLGQIQPDLIHLQHLMGLPVQVIECLERRNLPYLITLHDFWWICANAQLVTNYSQELCAGPNYYLNCARCALARANKAEFRPAEPFLALPLAWRNHQLRRVLDKAATVIAPTDFVKTWYGDHGLASDKLITLPHGLDPPSPRPISKRPQKGSLRFAYIGGLTWQKGVHIIIAAMAQLKVEAELWIAGDETTDPVYVAQLHAQAGDNIRFLGRLSRVEIWETLAQIDLILVPSLWYETFSFIISEAFAMSVPVLASKLGPLADRVQDGVNGLLVAPGKVNAWRDVLEKLSTHPDLIQKLRVGVQPDWTVADHVQALEKIYQIILDLAQIRSGHPNSPAGKPDLTG